MPTRYGLSFSVYTRDKQAAERFIDRVEAGMCHINLPTPHRDLALPLTGWGDSGHGISESDRYAMEFFTRVKAVYRKDTRQMC